MYTLHVLYIYIYTQYTVYVRVVCHGNCGRIHQLFRIQYTCFELDAVNVYWWIGIILCLV